MRDIYDYLDYREYLRDFYAERKAANPRFSHRYIAGKLGFDASLVSKIFQAKKMLSAGMLIKFIPFLGLDKRAGEYFETLVMYNQAKAHAAKQRYFERLRSFQAARAQKVEGGAFEIFGRWHNIAVLELLGLRPFDGDFRALAGMVMPAISPAEARAAVEVLEKHGFARRDPEGRYHRAEPALTSGDKASSRILDRYQLETLELARQAVDRFPKGERTLSTVTVSVSRQGYREMLEELRMARKRILAIARRDGRPERVYQFNFQVFPLSRPEGDAA